MAGSEELLVEAANGDQGDGGRDDRATAEAFFTTFRAEDTAIRRELGEVVGDAQAADVALDALLLRAQALETGFTRIAHVLPKYDLQKYRTGVKDMSNDIAAKREQLAPRKQFKFTRKKAAPKAEDARVPAEEVIDRSSATAPPVIGGLSAGEVFESLKNESIVRRDGEVAGRDVTLRDLEGCHVELLDRIGALHCHGLRRCEVLVGAVGSSALLYNCSECVLTFAGKQLRLHDSVKISLHLHSLSGPVIEHSSRILVSPYDLSYTGIEGHWAQAALGEYSLSAAANPGAWSDVQDFNWHKRQASPNWCLVPLDLRRHQLNRAAQVRALPPELLELDACGILFEVAGSDDRSLHGAGASAAQVQRATTTVEAAPAGNASPVEEEELASKPQHAPGSVPKPGLDEDDEF